MTRTPVILQPTPRQIRTLVGALTAAVGTSPGVERLARAHFAALRAAVAATLPGRQRASHIGPAMRVALPAYVRALRRQGKQRAR